MKINPYAGNLYACRVSTPKRQTSAAPQAQPIRFGSFDKVLLTLQRMRATMDQMEPMLAKAIRSDDLCNALARLGGVSDAEKALLLQVARNMDKSKGNTDKNYERYVEASLITASLGDAVIEDIAMNLEREQWGNPQAGENDEDQ